MKNTVVKPLIIKSFTLVELLLTIAIIAILAAMLLPALSKARERSRDSQCRSQFKQYNTALQMYSNDNQDYLGAIFPHGGSVYFGTTVAFPKLYNPYLEGRNAISGKGNVMVCPFISNNYPSNNTYLTYKCTVWWNCCKMGCDRAVISNTTYGNLGPVRKLGQVRYPSIAQIFRDVYPAEHFSTSYNNCGSPTSFVDGHVGFGKYYGNTNSLQNQNNWRGWDINPIF